MDPNVDEDLIEATIRRISEAQAERAAPADAARSSDAAADAEDAAEPEVAAGAETAIEGEPLTDEADAGEAPVAVADESAIEETIRRVAAARAEREGEPAEFTAPATDEAAIQETVRRVAAAHAERKATPPAIAESASPAFDDEPRPAAAAADLRSFAGDSPLTIVPRGRPVAAAAMREQPDADDAPWAEAIARIERTLAEIHAMLGSLVGRAQPSMPARPQPASQPHANEDEWEDEAPSVQRMAFTPPVRPAVFRDVPSAPSPTPALAHAETDERPRAEPQPPVHAESRRGFDLLPRTYRITVEDKRRGVDLVPLHRALLGMDGVRDMSLLSYNNGVAIVALETVNDIDTQALGKAVSRAMSREAAVEQHNERTLVVKLAED